MKNLKPIGKGLCIAALLYALGATTAFAAPAKEQPSAKNSQEMQNPGALQSGNEAKITPPKPVRKERQEVPEPCAQQRAQEMKTTLPAEILRTYAAAIKDERQLIIIDKSDYTLYLFQNGAQSKNYAVAVGKNPGQKQRVGDLTTPTGEFSIDEIVDASQWGHDFADGNGEIVGAYGPWFISLATDWIGIGIHGTHDPSSIGTMASNGCVRMANADVTDLKTRVAMGTKVIIVE